MGRAYWERRIRERVGTAQIHLRFPVWEGAEEANALVEETMARFYAFARKQAQTPGGFSAVVQYGIAWRQGEVLLSLRGYAGEPSGYELRPWATLCFAWQEKCPCQAVILPKKRRKKARERRSC